MPTRTEITDTLIALVPEDGSRITNAELLSALARELGEPVTPQDLDAAKDTVVAMGAAEKALGPWGWAQGCGSESTTEAELQLRKEIAAGGWCCQDVGSPSTANNRPWHHCRLGAHR